MTAAPDLLCEKRDGVATLTLNRPERKNAMTPQMLCLLAEAWQDLERDDEVRAVILTAQDLHRVGEVEKALDYLHEIAIQYPEWGARLQATAEDLRGSP